MTTVFLDAVFKLFFKIVHDTSQQLTIDRTNFLTDGFLQLIQRTGFVSVNTRFQIPSKKKITCWKMGRTRGPRNVSQTGNEVPGKHVSNNGHWLVCSVCCGTNLLKPHIGTVYSSSAQFWPSAYLLSTTHSKDVNFQWVTLYIEGINGILMEKILRMITLALCLILSLLVHSLNTSRSHPSQV